MTATTITQPIALARKARHRKPSRRRGTIKRAVKIAATGAAMTLLLAANGLAGVGPAAMRPAQGTSWIGAQASAVLTAELTADLASVNWTQATCSAEHAYVSNRGTLAAMIADAAHLSRSYLKADVLQLAADSSSPSLKAAKYIPGDETYAAEDCQS